FENFETELQEKRKKRTSANIDD
ncbi:unnamed protein product, partial [Didymodactylos carnosus]